MYASWTSPGLYIHDITQWKSHLDTYRCISTCSYIYIYLHYYIHTNVHIFLFKFMHINIHLRTHTHIYISHVLYICVYIYHVYIYIYIYYFFFIHIYLGLDNLNKLVGECSIALSQTIGQSLQRSLVMAQEQKSTNRKEQKAPKNTSCPRAARPVRRGWSPRIFLVVSRNYCYLNCVEESLS